jgi:hypothetical protein
LIFSLAGQAAPIRPGQAAGQVRLKKSGLLAALLHTYAFKENVRLYELLTIDDFCVAELTIFDFNGFSKVDRRQW